MAIEITWSDLEAYCQSQWVKDWTNLLWSLRMEEYIRSNHPAQAYADFLYAYGSWAFGSRCQCERRSLICLVWISEMYFELDEVEKCELGAGCESCIRDLWQKPLLVLVHQKLDLLRTC